MEEAPETAIRKAFRLSGMTYAQLGCELDLSKSYVGDIATGRKPVPPEKCKHIEHLCGKAVTAEQLRPDVFDPDIAA